jgi:hypothetical protein
VLLKKGIPEAAIGYLQEAETGFPAGHPDIGLVRIHLAMAFEASKQPEKAQEVLGRALGILDEMRKSAQAAGKEAPPEPSWAAEARSMQQRLSSAAAPQG